MIRELWTKYWHIPVTAAVIVGVCALAECAKNYDNKQIEEKKDRRPEYGLVVPAEETQRVDVRESYLELKIRDIGKG